MNSITQDILYKQSVEKYSFKNGVTKAAIKFKCTEKQYIDGVKNMMVQCNR